MIFIIKICISCRLGTSYFGYHTTFWSVNIAITKQKYQFVIYNIQRLCRINSVSIINLCQYFKCDIFHNFQNQCIRCPQIGTTRNAKERQLFLTILSFAWQAHLPCWKSDSLKVSYCFVKQWLIIQYYLHKQIYY